MVGWHHWLNGHESESTPSGQGGLACCSPRDHKESDMTEWLNWTNAGLWVFFFFFLSLRLLDDSISKLNHSVGLIQAYFSLSGCGPGARLYSEKLPAFPLSRSMWLPSSTIMGPSQFTLNFSDFSIDLTSPVLAREVLCFKDSWSGWTYLDNPKCCPYHEAHTLNHICWVLFAM